MYLLIFSQNFIEKLYAESEALQNIRNSIFKIEGNCPVTVLPTFSPYRAPIDLFLKSLI